MIGSTAYDRKNNAEEWKKIEEVWDDFDENKNGVLEKEEAFKFMTHMIKENTNKEPS